jgi:hypothetical protein
VVCAGSLAALATPAFAYDLGERFSLSGLLEAEAGFVNNSKDAPGSDNSDITAATVELHIDSKISDRVTGHVQLLWEENDTEPLDMDEATITLQLTDDWSVTAGKRYIPFGRFDSNMISDPLTLELAESQESVVQVGLDHEGLAGSVYAFKSKTDEEGKPADARQISSFGANLGYVVETGAGSFDLAASYVSNLGDSNNLRELGTAAIDSQVAGGGLFASYSNGPFTLIAEHITALDDFEPGDYGVVTDEQKASATNVEASYELPSGLMLALGYQKTSDLEFLLPENEKGYLATVSKEVVEGARLGIEYAAFDHYDGSDHQQVTVQLSAEF